MELQKTILAIALAVTALLTGCKEEKPEPKTTEYYQEHAEQRKEVLARCREMSMQEVMNDADCTNARRAKGIEQSSRRRGLNLDSL